MSKLNWIILDLKKFETYFYITYSTLDIFIHFNFRGILIYIHLPIPFSLIFPNLFITNLCFKIITFSFTFPNVLDQQNPIYIYIYIYSYAHRLRKVIDI